MNTLYKLWIKYRPRDFHYCKDVLALCVVAVLLAIILLLMDAYLERDRTCTPLEREANIRTQISELELKSALGREARRQEILVERPQTARIMATQWRSK